ncbi:MAG: 2-oxoglutarate dehydrogenase complex dihydrolipoyllysine-residue succinyltransferase [Proteobacteria bacterium]|nr:2-oxoglutarate dehydrogenase complex dihydrolipoyllysine-residue succinyltransferase [Pseudomonadota bacterium]
MPTEIKVPTLGESVTSATIARWLKQEGDQVAADEPLVELETDKVTVEVNSPAPGVLGAILQKDGAEVEVGAVLGEISEVGGAAASKTRKGTDTKAAPAKAAPAAAEPAPVTPSSQAPAPASAGGTTDIVVPTLGESVATATVSRWLKQQGDAVKADEPLLELETDKVSVEVNAPASGTLSVINAQDGAEVEVGAVLGAIATGAGAVAPSNKPAAKPDAGVNPPPRANGPVARPGTPPSDRAAALEAFPSASKRMTEAGIPPASIGAGSGKDGRITKGDVLDFLAKPAQTLATPAPAAKAPRSDEPRDERVKMTRLRRTIASRLKEAQNTAAMLTTFNDVDMSAAMSLRSQYKDAFEKKNNGVRLGFMSFFVRACIAGLKEFPAVNAEIDGEDIVYKNYVHMGIAVGGANGLVVPVLRDADQMSFAQIEGAIANFGKRARDGQLKIDELTGGTFSITNGGVYGSLMSTPIINPPQSAILGMHKIQERPIAIGGKVEIRPMMYLALTYDHRIIDGKEAVSFLVRVKEAIEDPRRLLLGL